MADCGVQLYIPHRFHFDTQTETHTVHQSPFLSKKHLESISCKLGVIAKFHVFGKIVVPIFFKTAYFEWEKYDDFVVVNFYATLS